VTAGRAVYGAGLALATLAGRTRARLGRRGVLALAATSALLVVAGVVTLVTDDTAPAPPTAVPRPADPAAPAPARPASDVRWVDTEGVMLPVSRTAGPRDLSAGRARGFARTDLGAALAALHISMRTAAGNDEAVWGPTIREQVVGVDQPLFLAVTAREFREEAGGEPDAAVQGWRVAPGEDAYAREVHLLLSSPDPGGGLAYVDLRAPVVWQAGDWRLVAPTGGDWQLTSTLTDRAAQAGYHPFGG
jgi:hypothetical protein